MHEKASRKRIARWYGTRRRHGFEIGLFEPAMVLLEVSPIIYAPNSTGKHTGCYLLVDMPFLTLR